MQNGRNTNRNTRHSRPAGPYAGRSKRWTSNAARPEPQGSQNAQRNYERYLALAQAEAQSGNLIAAENNYQYAEHYFRMMSADREGT
jgi:Domain of unknown function (DUF4167)